MTSKHRTPCPVCKDDSNKKEDCEDGTEQVSVIYQYYRGGFCE